MHTDKREAQQSSFYSVFICAHLWLNFFDFIGVHRCPIGG